MPKATTTITDVLKVMFLNNYDPAWRTQANLYLALHTADPGVGGTQTTNETAYTGYLRVAIVKTAVGFTIVTNTAKNAALAQFPQCSGNPQTISHVSIGLSDSGVSGQILYSGALNAPLAVANLIQPQFAINALVVTES